MQETGHPVLMSCSVASHSVTPRTTARQAPRSIAFPRLEYWSESPFPSPGALPDPGTEPTSPAWQADSSPPSHLGRSKSPVTRERGDKESPGPLTTLPRGCQFRGPTCGWRGTVAGERQPCCGPGPHQFLLNTSSEACWYRRLLTRSVPAQPVSEAERHSEQDTGNSRSPVMAALPSELSGLWASS